jgi:hypothetical protein
VGTELVQNTELLERHMIIIIVKWLLPNGLGYSYITDDCNSSGCYHHQPLLFYEVNSTTHTQKSIGPHNPQPYIPPAIRTARITMQPLLNTPKVKAMLTIRQHNTLILPLKIRQAYTALMRYHRIHLYNLGIRPNHTPNDFDLLFDEGGPAGEKSSLHEPVDLSAHVAGYCEDHHAVVEEVDGD